jgi:hypothetical protein
MPVRLFRQILSVLLMAAYVSATILTAVPGANAAPPAMAGGTIMMTGQTGDAMPMPCSKGMKSGCVSDFGCIFMVSLPATHSSPATMISWAPVSYALTDEFPPENSIKPALGPPISRA